MAELGYFVYRGAGAFQFGQAGGGSLSPNTQLIAMALYRDYMLPFEVASILLLVAILGAVILAKKQI
jgi:NADH-quinone oxidoreductase subunit J